VDNNAYISTHSSDPEMDERAMSEVRQEISDLEESIKMALDEGLHDEAEEYETDLKKLRQCTRGSFITKTKSKRLDTGDSMKKLTNAIRVRGVTAIKNLRKEGAVDTANHLNEYYKVGDRHVSYSPAGAIPNWILDPPTGKTA